MSLPDSDKLMQSRLPNRSIAIDVRARRAERWFGVLALLATAVVTSLSFPYLWLPAVMLIGAGLWRQGWLGGAHRVAKIAWLPEGHWQLCDERHTTSAELRPDSRLGAHWLWLRWNAESPTSPRCRSMLLVRGDIPHTELRRLLVRLRVAA